MPRLFIAIDLPSRIREDIANICYGVPNVKWVDVQQLHLTLHFIGDVDGPTAETVLDLLADVSVPRFTMRIHGVGHFPPRKDPRTVWVGVEPGDEMNLLHRRVGAVLVEAGAVPEKRTFHPHITIARVKEHTPIDAIAPFLVAHSLFSTEVVQVREFHLYSSILRESGAIHTKERSYRLM